ncbi:LacI family transcriptional regulator [Miniimonas arenae]|uniref:LacI family transcriptional regulator n=1 Tax=Miniimonas arenae TaxID=676201 RepID=A0A5C5BEW0_9MICO|nr:LacI family DNA-binding transcriptional regulator [Miniimonas arenae]TNU76436.1 LacI family transcriptional regulator [Miniimonas arenae]
MAATMRDVAALAGVSLKTVSRVVNLEPHIRPEVIRRVRAAIAELGWVPNGSARALRTGRTNVVAVAVPHLQRPYHALLAEALVVESNRRGMQAAVEPTHRDPARVEAVLSSVGRSFDGALVMGRLPDGLDPELLRTRPVVLVQAEPVDGVDAVSVDLVEAASLLARHLVVMGRRRPALIGWDRFTSGEAVIAAALSPDSPDTLPRVSGVTTRADGAAAAESLLASSPDVDAVVCASDEIATGVLHVLAERGIEVPRAVAVTGFDGIDEGLFATPSLTTIDPGPAALARHALDLLLDGLSSTPPQAGRHVLAPVSLVRRETTLGQGVA